MMTEEQAKGKICHKTLAQDEPNCCIGSACMAWRWGETETVTTQGVAIVEGLGARLKILTKPRENRRGYCGLAGEPDK